MKSVILLLIAFCINCNLSFGQNEKNYTNPVFDSLTRDYRKIAILPFKTTLTLRPREMKRLQGSQLTEMQLDQGRAIQAFFQLHYDERNEGKNNRVMLINLNDLNNFLDENKITDDQIDKYSPSQLSELLGVDGIILGTLLTEKPMSRGASVALSVLVTQGLYPLGSSERGFCQINFIDGKSGTLLWRYGEKAKLKDWSNPSDSFELIDKLMRKASKEMPNFKNQ